MDNLSRHVTHCLERRGDDPLQRRGQDQRREQAERDDQRQNAEVGSHAPHHIVAGPQIDRSEPLAIAHDELRQLDMLAGGARTGNHVGQQLWWRRRA